MNNESLKEHIDAQLCALIVTETLKERILSRTASQPRTKVTKCTIRVVLVAALIIALTGGTLAIAAITDRINFLSGGGSMLRDREGIGMIGYETEPEWLVEETDGKMLLRLGSELYDITEEYSKKGYVVRDYYDSSGSLHRVFILKTNGGTERAYAQNEQIPKFDDEGKITGSANIQKGFSDDPGDLLSEAIGYANYSVYQGHGALDEMLEYYLDLYWSGEDFDMLP